MNEFEMVEKLVEKANVSFEEARDALRACDGDPVDALVYLEKKEKTDDGIASSPAGETDREETDTGSENICGNSDDAEPAAEETGRTETVTGSGKPEAEETSHSENHTDCENPAADDTAAGENEKEKAMKEAAGNTERNSRKSEIRGFFRKVKEFLFTNFLTVTRNGEEKLKVPVWLPVLLIVFSFRFTVIALVISLFLGCRYSFTGKNDLSGANQFMDQAGDMAEKVKAQFRS